MTAVPRLVVAAPASGSGKTTVATGLMAAFAAGGLAVSPHKVGPDYIDPGYHALATGRPGRNLDAYMCGPDLLAPLFAHGAAGADVAVVEGVMGLYDGAGGDTELGSTAQVAKLLRAPVVLVVDASAQSRSVAALVHGFASWDPEVRVAGVVLNKVGSERHEGLLREALEGAGVEVLGALRRTAEVAAPSRHLGLVPAAERRAEAAASVRALAALVRESCDLEALLRLARSAPRLTAQPWSPAESLSPAPPLPETGDKPPAPQGCAAPEPRGRGAGGLGGGAPGFREGAGSGNNPLHSADRRVRPQTPDGLDGCPARPVVAVAAGGAFTFSYAEHTELLTAAGADVVPFDPLRDEALPEGAAALVVGGGFPEVYGAELAANEPLRKAVAELAATGAPVAAECGGLLYLARSLDGAPMCGVLDADARMTDRLTLGYRDAVAVHDSALAAAGTRVRGHEFHRTTLDPPAGRTPAWGVTYPARRVEGFVQGGVHASYLHVHWAAAPSIARRLVERAGRCEAAA